MDSLMIEMAIFTISMVSLIIGSDRVIKASEQIALQYNISPFVIGASLVALGTSLPELGASVSSSIKGVGEIAVANVIGSTIFNIALVLGIVFLLSKKINSTRDIFKKDSFFIILPMMIFIVLGFDGVFDVLDGFVFLIMMVSFVLFLIYDEVDLSDEIDEMDTDFSWLKTIFMLMIGFIFIIIGANFAIDSASSIALSLGVDNWVVGIFLVAFGTSLPELVVSIVAVYKNQADLAIGAIIGSNVANFSIVLGLSSMINNLKIDFSTMGFDIMMAMILSILFVFITATKSYTKSSGLILLSFVVVLISHQF